jgi:hypothetical protein
MIEPRLAMLMAHLSIGAASLNQAQLKLCRSLSKADEHFVVARWNAHFQTSGRSCDYNRTDAQKVPGSR